ncbi:glycoside hydrolase family 43 protein [Caulobacter hibisci]|uniref:glycoside hydrolase family 43 protein n=1 Tax=Caulobacter hibisci TaxID=2035993 RepID=UPI0018E30C2B|nr:glycoside hydrolase family 43 protein [Caulobacter hibisci]
MGFNAWRRRSLGICASALALALLGTTPALAAPTGKQVEIVSSLKPSARKAIPPASAQTAYLMVYFKDETHSVHFATSPDGYVFTDVNNGEPVLRGEGVAEQKGVRDPHIVRGPDGAFYLALTDLHIYAKQKGLRADPWERPEKDYGWGNNRALILMKSYDLVHWTHAIVRVDKLFPQLGDIGCAWAPETIYDPERKAMMVYFTTRVGAGRNSLAYAYADEAFTTLTTQPKPLLAHPDPAQSLIDGDITKVGDTYHLFAVGYDKPAGIRHATSKSLTGGYVYEPGKIDPEAVAAEAPTLWRRAGSGAYVLMYDVFGAKPNNMGFSETTDFVHYRNLGRFNDPGSPMKATNFQSPKHGAVIPVSPAEVERLKAWFVGK